jgi:hypothetical protein
MSMALTQAEYWPARLLTALLKTRKYGKYKQKISSPSAGLPGTQWLGLAVH